MLTRPDRTALGLWLVTRLAMLVTVAWTLPALGGFLGRWQHWDASIFVTIARHGYDGDPSGASDPGLPGFFPGFPLALRVVHALVPNWTAAGLLISFASSAVATVALCRLGELEGPAGTGPRAALLLLLSPAAVFLMAGYSEALFLAFAIPSWLLARQGRWPGAAVCCALAAGVRFTGVFLAAALVVEFCTGPFRRRRDMPWPALPFLVPLAYSAYQWTRTGDWLAYQHAQEHWAAHRLTAPWQALRTTWAMATGRPGYFTVAMRLDLLVAAIGVALTLWLLRRRSWSELVYLLPQLVIMLSGAYYISLARYMLTWWPLWIALGRHGVKHPWTFATITATSAATMIVMVEIYTSGAWAG